MGRLQLGHRALLAQYPEPFFGFLAWLPPASAQLYHPANWTNEPFCVSIGGMIVTLKRQGKTESGRDHDRWLCRLVLAPPKGHA